MKRILCVLIAIAMLTSLLAKTTVRSEPAVVTPITITPVVKSEPAVVTSVKLIESKDEWQVWYVLISPDSLIVRFDVEVGASCPEGMIACFLKLKNSFIFRGWKETTLPPQKQCTMRLDYGDKDSGVPTKVLMYMPDGIQLSIPAEDTRWLAKTLPILLTE